MKAKLVYSIHDRVTQISVLGLLLLRFLDGWMHFKWHTASAWLDPVWQIGTYALTVFLIWWEWKNLNEYHFNPLAILILIFFPPISKIALAFYNSTSILAFPEPLSYPFFAFAGGLIYLVIKKKFTFKVRFGKELIWFLFSAVLGILLAGLESILMIKWMGYPKGTAPGLIALTAPVYQLGYAASLEEPLFRGLLWGVLRKAKLNDLWIWIIQAGLFALAHIYYLNSINGLLFIGMIFVDGLITGLLVWRTRLLSSSMAFHAFFNGSSYFLYWLEWVILK